MIGIGVIGYGYWGPNLVRNLAEAPGASLIAISDIRAERLSHAGRRYPSLRLCEDYSGLLADPAVGAVAIATPVSSHFELAMLALRSDKHVLVEKPLASNSAQAAQLIDEAARRNLV